MKKNSVYLLFLFSLLLTGCDTIEGGVHAIVHLVFFFFKVGLVVTGIYIVFIILVNLFGKK